jgi:hypothetical protein
MTMDTDRQSPSPLFGAGINGRSSVTSFGTGVIMNNPLPSAGARLPTLLCLSSLESTNTTANITFLRREYDHECPFLGIGTEGALVLSWTLKNYNSTLNYSIHTERIMDPIAVCRWGFDGFDAI